MGTPRIVQPENEKEAVRIAIEGGDPRDYLAGLGLKAPQQAWSQIRQKVKDHDPETFEKLPKTLAYRKKAKETPEGSLADAVTGMKDAAETFFGECQKMGLNIETPETPKICMPVNYDGMMVREVEGNFARYRRSDIAGTTYIDIEVTEGCDTLSYTVDHWRKFRKEQEKAAVILGVEL